MGRFFIKNKHHIIIDPYQNSTIEDIRDFLFNIVIGFILHLHNFFVLHACSIDLKGTGIAICGASGVGKSSIATKSHQMRVNLVSDDISPIKFENKRPFVYPGGSTVRLWRDTIEAFGYSSNELEPIAYRLDKFNLPLEGFSSKPVPLKQVIHLETKDSGEIEYFDVSSNMKKINLLQRDGYFFPSYYYFMNVKEIKETKKWHFLFVCSLIQHVKVSRIIRPKAMSMQEFHKYFFEQVLNIKKGALC